MAIILFNESMIYKTVIFYTGDYYVASKADGREHMLTS